MYALKYYDETITNNDEQKPVTTVISRLVKAGKENDYEAWAAGISEACATFKGYMGTDILRPNDHAHSEYVTIFRFDTYDNLRTWEISDAAQAWIDKLPPLIARENIQQITGLDFWFTQQQAQQPSVFKMSIVTWVGLAPLVLIVPPLMEPFFRWLPTPVFITLSTGVTVFMMSYWVLPLATRVFRNWLYPQANA